MFIRTFILAILIMTNVFTFPLTFKRKKLTPADADYWYRKVKSKINLKPQNTRQAKNVIFFLGDAMSISTLTAARIYLSQIEGLGEVESDLAFDKFPYSGFVKTHCLNQVTPDSACTATSYLGGVRANYGTIGVSGAVTRKNCKEMNRLENRVNSIARLFQLNGKRTGVVTTAKITDASPSGIYAHTAERDWQSDINVINDGQDPKECMDIASQLIYGDTGRSLNVVFAGGRSFFVPDSEINAYGETGNRTDGRNLINEWHQLKRNTFHSYVTDRDGMFAINSKTDYALGLFHEDNMSYNFDRNKSKEPSLREMTKKAIQLVSQDGNGYFLFVEGARIDHAHHISEAQVAIDEMVELNKAIQAALDMTDSRNTLIIVTADHSNTMTLSGYTNWSTPLTKLAAKDADGFPYAIINYATGPGYKASTFSRYNLTNDEFNPHYKYPTLTPTLSSKHGTHDVGVFANGPWAHLFSGVMEQYLIPHKIAYAAGFDTDYE